MVIIVGEVEFDYEVENQIYNCFNQGRIEGKYSTGGIVGSTPNGSHMVCEINNCYNTGEIGGEGVGGLVGKAGSATVVRNSYYKFTGNGELGIADNQANTASFEAKSEEEMKTQDFVDELNEIAAINGWNLWELNPEEAEEPVHRKRYAITFANMEHGVLSTEMDSAYSGDRVLVKVSADRKYAYEEGSFTVKSDLGETVETTKEENGFSFVMPAAPVTVSAFFEKT